MLGVGPMVNGVRRATCTVCSIEFEAEPRGRLPKRCPEHSTGNRRCVSCSEWCRPRPGNDKCAACLASECRQCGVPIAWPLRSFCSAECGAAHRRRSVISCKGCGAGIHDPHGSQSYCSVQCRRRSYRRLKPAVANGPRRPRPWTEKRKASSQRRRALIHTTAVETILPREVFERDGWACGICGGPVDAGLLYPDPMSASLDHVVPLIRGGTHTHDNLACAHLRCNLQKGERLLAELEVARALAEAAPGGTEADQRVAPRA
jgi:hypothetical protein